MLKFNVKEYANSMIMQKKVEEREPFQVKALAHRIELEIQYSKTKSALEHVHNVK